jgi:hypothetical protein
MLVDHTLSSNGLENIQLLASRQVCVYVCVCIIYVHIKIHTHTF